MPSHAKPSLEAGLVALKQGNYQTAIAQLEPIASIQSNATASLQAQVGLVMAYARTGEVPKAIAISQNLIESNNPQVQEWARRALEHLTKRKKPEQESKKIETGFVAFENSTPDSTPDSTSVTPPETPTLEEKPNEQVIETKSDDIPPMVPLARLKATLATPPTPLSGFMGSVTRTQAKLFGVIYWRQAQRARAWQPLRKPKLIPLRLLSAGTFIALFWVIREILKLALGFINQTLVKLPYLEPIQLLYHDPTQMLLIVLVILIGVSPWLLDLLLANLYGQREFPKDVLNTHSREAIRVLQRCCQQRHWPLPKLRILPTAAPIILTYGSLPRNARIVVSQGLLEQLADDEIAIIYATQLGHIAHWDFAVMSLLLLVTLPTHKLYQQVSELGDKISAIWRWPVTILGSLIYGIWCLLTGTALWLSRLRLYYSDRVAAEITGNPNALIRALLKIAIGIAADIQKQEHTSWQLESLNLLTPVSYQQSLSLGTIASNLSFESFLKWDTANPYRQWFTINNSHPLMGDRLERLCQIVRHWHLDTELHFASEPSKVKRQSFLLQVAPWLGIPLGVLFAAFVWLTWQLAFTLKFLNLKWIYEDWSFITGCLLIGFSIGTVMRINSFFPDIKPSTVQTDDSLPNLLADPSALPIDSVSVRLVGKLLGRQGTSNSLAQDLILQSSAGLVKLHHISWLGQSVNHQDLIGRQIIVTGWFRRGATPWIDIQTLETQSGKTIHSPHPIWSTFLAVAAQAWGAYVFLTG
ncbi:M48 family metallopeptidase [Nostoc sp. 'Lobaria pulmonaria (5183) cyanobiont']|uniref:M48 family metallopeptidase n=1 Tax=Nostoc sp. 'Lobaria pulmonaria (5183) cyanobiont' TaxID=1618022 RepID=UPI000CF34635|nr:M48 family metallopeptidase [Nostoc sp. 'Lobaria pulmonaria (5183) cyanobiont']AVH72009.1 peptidase M48/Zn-dependent protease with chaperone function [Nostoc sp. 'Lobaria pulmonaria (5183) cyanobiont']